MKSKLLILTLCATSAFTAYSMDSKGETKRQVAAAAETKKAVQTAAEVKSAEAQVDNPVNAAMQTARNYFKGNNGVAKSYEKAIPLLVEVACQTEDLALQAEANNYLGWIAYYGDEQIEKKPAQAFQFFTLAVENDELASAICASVCFGLGLLWYEGGHGHAKDCEMAYAYIVLALDRAKEGLADKDIKKALAVLNEFANQKDDLLLQVRAWKGLGSFASDKEQYDDAIKYFMLFSEQTTDLIAQAEAWYDLAEIFQDKLKDLPKALDYYDKCINVPEDLHKDDVRRRLRFLARRKLGIGYYNGSFGLFQNYALAAKYLEPCSEDRGLYNDRYSSLSTLISLSEMYLSGRDGLGKDRDKALSFLKELENMLVKSSDSDKKEFNFLGVQSMIKKLESEAEGLSFA